MFRRFPATVDKNSQRGSAIRPLTEGHGCEIIREKLLSKISAERYGDGRSEIRNKGNARDSKWAVRDGHKVNEENNPCDAELSIGSERPLEAGSAAATQNKNKDEKHGQETSHGPASYKGFVCYTVQTTEVSPPCKISMPPSSFRFLSSLASPANLTDGGAGVGIWTADDSSKGPLRFNCFSFLGKHVDGVRVGLGKPKEGDFIQDFWQINGRREAS